MKLRGNYELDLKETFHKSLTPIIIIMVLAGLILGFVALVCSEEKESYLNYSDFIAVANKDLTNEQRKSLATVVSLVSEDDIGEDGLFVEHEKPFYFSELMSKSWLALILILLILLSISTSIVYWTSRDKDYYLADLPLNIGWSYYIIVSNFATWPVLFISAILFWRFKYKVKIASSEENAKRLPEVEAVFEKDDFIKYCTGNMQIDSFIDSAERRVSEVQRTINDYARKIKDLQTDLSQRQAELNELLYQKSTLSDTSYTEKQFASDFEQIKSMRGVQQIFVRHDSLIIRVRVVYPYKEMLYDFGDYEVLISGTSFRAQMVRDNIGDPGFGQSYNYYGTGDFCFGNRRDEISSYISQNRIVEAMELIIDCLYYVNPENRDNIPNDYEAVCAQNSE